MEEPGASRPGCPERPGMIFLKDFPQAVRNELSGAGWDGWRRDGGSW